MIQHIVMLRLQAGYDAAELAGVMNGLGGLDLPGFVGFAHGPNLDLVTTYANDPGHQALGARLVALCGGADGIMVMDLAV